jgi:O-antigen/teichoic acid export membrane protein
LIAIAAATKSQVSYVAAQIGAKALGLTFLVVAASATSDAVFGQFVIASLVSAFLVLVLDFGRGADVLRVLATRGDLRLADDQVRRLKALWIGGGVLAALGLVGPTSTLRLGSLAGALGLVMGANATAEGALLGLGSGLRAGVANLTYNALAATGVLIWALAYSLTPSSLIGAQLVGAAGAAMVSGHAVCRRSEPSRNTQAPDSNLAHRRSGIVHVVLFLGSKADQLLLSILDRSRSLGEYGLAARVAEIGTAPPSVLSSAVQPNVARAIDSGKLVSRPFGSIVGLACGLAIVIAVVGPHAVADAGSHDRTLSILVRVMSVGIVSTAVQYLGLLVARCAGPELHASETLLLYVLQAVASAVAAGTGWIFGGVIGMAFARVAMDSAAYTALLLALSRRSMTRLPRGYILIAPALVLGAAVATIPGDGGLLVLATLVPVMVMATAPLVLPRHTEEP